MSSSPLLAASLFADESHLCIAFSEPNFRGKVRAYHGPGNIFVGLWNNKDVDRQLNIGSLILNVDEAGARRLFLSSQQAVKIEKKQGEYRQSGYVFAAQKQFVAIENMGEWLFDQNSMETLGMGNDDQVFLEFLDKSDAPASAISEHDAPHTSLSGSAVKKALEVVQADEDAMDMDAEFIKYQPDSSGHDATFEAQHADGDVAPDAAARGIGAPHTAGGGHGGKKSSQWLTSLTKDMKKVPHSGRSKWYIVGVFLMIVFILLMFYVCYWLYANIRWLKVAVVQLQKDHQLLGQNV